MKDGSLIGLAALFERWLSPEGEVLDTCAIVTTPANSLVRSLHDRMPLIIAPEDYARWLDRSVEDVTDLLSPYPASAMNFYPVSTRVNAVRNDDPSIIEPVEVANDETAEAMPSPEQASLF
jgi:putative SOS response-associated peptidase YedK